MNGNNELENIKAKAYKICVDYLQGPWKETSVDDFKLLPVTGGLSSGVGLFLCSVSNETSNRDEEIPSQVIIRFHNTNIRSDDEIIKETVIFAIMSEKKMGPKLLGVFPGGRLEEYIPSRSTDWNDFSVLYASVAKGMAKIHQLDIPMEKTPLFKRQTFQRLEDIEKSSKENQALRIPEFISNGEFRGELTWLAGEFKKLNPKVVFCHNDLQGGNILLLNDCGKNDNKKVVFIDFEFAAYNYRTYDIVDHFNEKCFYYKPTVKPYTFTVKLENFPTKPEQEEFVNEYINELKKSYTNPNDFNSEKVKKEILREIPIMRLAPLLYWCTDTIKNSFNPPIDFPFWDTSHLLWNAYKTFKSEIEDN